MQVQQKSTGRVISTPVGNNKGGDKDGSILSREETSCLWSLIVTSYYIFFSMFCPCVLICPGWSKKIKWWVKIKFQFPIMRNNQGFFIYVRSAAETLAILADQFKTLLALCANATHYLDSLI